MSQYLKSIATGLMLLVSAGSVFAQSASTAPMGSSVNAGAMGTMHPAQVAKGATPANATLMSVFTGQLPPDLIAQLALTKEQENKLDAAQIARHSLWAANRRARQSEYDLIAKELENDQFDPRDIVKLRKKIRQDADKRMDDVQNAWLEFWDVLNESQRKQLVTYIKIQHRKLAKAPDPAATATGKSTK